MKKFLIGVDEAGRGPIAGPVAVGAVLLKPNFPLQELKGVRDCKKLTPLAREAWYQKMLLWRKGGLLEFSCSFSAASVIDRRGIVLAVRAALNRAVRRFEINPRMCRVLLDGGLVAPDEFTNQLTIIGGDDLEPVIALASIVAKVRRDRRMLRLAKLYEGYLFEVHKGYGTKAHYRALKQNGLSDIHRRSFLRSLIG